MPSLFDCQYPPELRTREEAFIANRRGAAGLNERQKSQPVVGLAFSGGGIRSATFCLGVLRALAGGKASDPNRISLRGVDVLSTVSGGGYVGAFLGALFSRDDAKPESVEQQLSSPHSQAVHWLRENGRYLAPNGSGDQWLAASTVLRNWVAVAVVMSTTVLAALMVAQLARVIAGDVIPSETLDAIASRFAQPVYSIYWSPLLVAPLLTLLFIATPFGWAYWSRRSRLVCRGCRRKSSWSGRACWSVWGLPRRRLCWDASFASRLNAANSSTLRWLSTLPLPCIHLRSCARRMMRRGIKRWIVSSRI